MTQLLTPANIIAQINGKSTIGKEEIEEATHIFYDAKSSAELLKQHESKYLK